MGEQQKGYVPAYADNSSFYIPGVLHVERDDSRMLLSLIHISEPTRH